MENHFYHIRLAPLSVTIFITHMHLLFDKEPVDGFSINKGFNSFLAKGNLCYLLLTFENSLDQDQGSVLI